MPRLVIVGVPGEKRMRALLDAAARGGVEARSVPFRDALAAPERVALAGRAGDYLRVDSPGADAETYHALARLGGDARALAHAEWRPGRAWFLGLARFLGALDAHTRELHATHPSEQILAMTDKVACQERLARAGVPVPEALPEARSAAELRAHMQAAGVSAVYVKPRWGSSGAGVLAFRRGGGRELLATTLALEEDRCFNHKRLRRYHERAPIDRLLDTVLGDGALVQRWVPKAGTARGPFDLRVLVARGRIAQSVGRIGRGTITNLHLDAERIRPEDALAPFGARALERVHAVCRRAAACFAGHHAVGVDVMVDPAGEPFVLECNAWGDYLPRLWIDGQDSYDVYVRGLSPAERAS